MWVSHRNTTDVMMILKSKKMIKRILTLIIYIYIKKKKKKKWGGGGGGVEQRGRYVLKISTCPLQKVTTKSALKVRTKPLYSGPFHYSS
jgi:hypothetical protein